MYFSLRAAGHQVSGTSHMYTSGQFRDTGMAFVWHYNHH
ncbi:TPA: hypothetical protein U2R15_004161 [Klebsiella aerogenes]|nr:hypothetical protein [Klebsiella aerogenes]